jgi:pimeloyl-ACP methyl ester carboxylesterase
MIARFLMLAVVAMSTTLLAQPPDTYANSPLPDSQPDAPRFQNAPCPFPLGPDQVEGRTVTCGFVIVPEDRSRSAGPSIRLAVAVFKSQAAVSAPPLIFLGSGPGNAILQARGPVITGQLGHDVTDGHDLILFDQRGVGFAQPSLACQEMTDLKYQRLGVQISRAEEIDGSVQASLLCRDRLQRAGINLAAYTTAASVADVDDIRRALGYTTMDLWGLSYGTRLALTIMETNPKTVRAAVLDSTLPPQVHMLVDIPGNAERSFRLLFDGCASDRACATAYPNLEATFYQLVAELNVTPLRYQARHPRTGVVYSVVLTGDGLVRALTQALYSTTLIPLLPLVGASLRQGDTTLLARLAEQIVFDDSANLGLYYSVQCAEEANLTNPAEVAAARRPVRPEIGDVFTQEDLFRTCAAWGAARVSPSIKTPVVSPIPTLILAGQFDPATPPRYGLQAGRTLPQSFFFEFPGVGHNVGFGSPCAHAIMMQFLKTPTRRPDDGCIADMGPPSWVIPPPR